MKLHQGNMWHVPGFHVVTTNSYVRRDGCLVMGRGSALEAKERYPWLPLLAGGRILDACGHLGHYHFLLFVKPEPIGLFQVKDHFKSLASFPLIKESVKQLSIFANLRPGNVVMNFPGIGFGGLIRSQVLPLLRDLPDNVIICEWRKRL